MSSLLLLLLVTCVQAAPQADLITDLPGLTFQPNFKQYSGYLNLASQNHLFYWFTESQSNPSKDPVVLWLNGGPGCSSINGMLSELGPLHPSKDGNLIENVNAWNKEANVIYLDSPRDVGWSYRDPAAANDTVYSDDKTASDNLLAVIEFFKKFPEYAENRFYVAGESYGGVYAPMLTDLLIKTVQNGTLKLNIAGMTIGNGILNMKHQVNSAVDLAYYRGFIGKTEYDSLRSCCADSSGRPLADCDFTQWLYMPPGDYPTLKNYTNEHDARCGREIMKLGKTIVWSTQNNEYNSYEDCYDFSGDATAFNDFRTAKPSRLIETFRQLSNSDYHMFTDGSNPFVDQGAKINRYSTDALFGFPCFRYAAQVKFMNRADVQKALHVRQGLPDWQGCSDVVGDTLVQTHNDMTPTFQSIIDSKHPMSLLIYNGDADLACNFLGDEWFIEALAKSNKMNVTQQRYEWFYQRGPQFLFTTAGFAKQFTASTTTIDLVTVKGAGHMVPRSRAAASQQMLTNFLRGTNNYTTPTGISHQPQPLMPQYQAPPEKPFTRKQASRVWSLPGLTYSLNFKQYSGYLHGVTGNYLHYWLVESQSNPLTDPLILWLNGGPGCSSLGGLLTELGPFHANADNNTLFENIYSWNKAANVLFLEGPRNVGFSYQNQSENPDQGYDDAKTAMDNYLAIKDFLTVYPEYVNRPFYVTGESYGGVYVPTLTSLLIDKIQSGNIVGLNLVGMAVGNGELSELQQFNSAPHLLYFHGMSGKTEWDALQKCCPTSTGANWFEQCDFSAHISVDSAGRAHPRNISDPCGQMVVDMSQTRIWDTINFVYNMYQDCYQQTSTVFGSRVLSAHKEKVRNHLETKMNNKDAGFVDQGSLVSSYSTDSQGGFPCFASSAAANWLNNPDVRAALHINPLASKWIDCNSTINSIYTQQHNDTGAVFDHIVQSGYPLRMLIYNGDVDMACNFLGDQWFIEDLAKRQAMTASMIRDAWRFRSQIAGYAQQFAFASGTIDLLTVKGAGHFVPTDRPGPAQQMITNFVRGQDYSNPLPYDLHRTELNKHYEVAAEIAATTSHGVSRRVFKKTMKNKRSKRAAATAASSVPGSRQADKVPEMPGVTFNYTFDMYAGYLSATTGNHLHYWYVESQRSPSTDPVVMWMNGGPGCTSTGGLLEEIGPFHVNNDGATLYENVYSWNKRANLVFMDSPRGVGYSYRDGSAPPDDTWNDDKTVADLLLAIESFFKRFSELQKRPFYIAGESYGGVYVPTLTDALIKKIQDGSMSYVNLKGVSIGNGMLSQLQQLNSAVSLMYFRGMHGLEQWNDMSQCCGSAVNGSVPQTYCNWVDYVQFDNHGNPTPKHTDGSMAAMCGQKVVQQAYNDVWLTDNDVYNTFQDCYTQPPTGANVRAKRSDDPRLLHNAYPFIDQAAKINYDSTDAQGGYACYDGDAVTAYMNRDDVKKALHVADELSAWVDCNLDINAAYIQQHNDTTAVFESIIASNYPLHVLIYNGDVDMACQFLGDEWFVEALAASHQWPASLRAPWNYTQTGFNPQIGGYSKRFNAGKTFQLDLITVKGAGHFVPTDRPGPALQMISNFLDGADYSHKSTMTFERQPLLEPYQPVTDHVPRRKADMIFSLPGVTFQPQFHQHSGYLKASEGNYMHYWFVESQHSPSSDPVILWLNGGPGCSSMGGVLMELGPFYPNPDGKTLFENVYSWNRYANIIFLDSPRQVGFSYQDPAVSNDTMWNDKKTAADTALALADFFNEYEGFRKNDFYVSGESYAGVYVPTLTRLLIQQIQANTLQLNLKGISIGNGMVSVLQDIRSLPDFMYFHGRYEMSTWERLKQCCSSDNVTFLQCDYDQFVTVDSQGNVAAKNPNDECGKLVASLAFDRVWNSQDDVYNMYQSCYANEVYSFGQMMSAQRMESNARIPSSRPMNLRGTYATQVSHLDNLDTTSTGGLQCYMTNAVTSYLNQTHVRAALNVPDFVQPWQICSDSVADNYVKEYNDTTPVFQDIIDSGYPLKILLYNGDVDTACSMFEAEWFTEALTAANNMKPIAERTHWEYGQTIAGYIKQFAGKSVTIDLLTVKGAGHMVPVDRAGPALQMITNFLRADNYNTSLPQIQRQPLFAQYQQTGDGPLPVVTTTTPPTTTEPITTSLSSGMTVFVSLALALLNKLFL